MIFREASMRRANTERQKTNDLAKAAIHAGGSYDGRDVMPPAVTEQRPPLPTAQETNRVDAAPTNTNEELETAQAAPAEDRNAQIARRAYERYLSRGGDHGYDMQDWLDAERELANEGSAPIDRTVGS